MSATETRNRTTRIIPPSLFLSAPRSVLAERARRVGGELARGGERGWRAFALAIQACAGARAAPAAWPRSASAPAISACAASTSRRASTAAGIVAWRRIDRPDAHQLAGVGLQAFEEAAGRRLRARHFLHGRDQRTQFLRQRGCARHAGSPRTAAVAPGPFRRRRAISPASSSAAIGRAAHDGVAQRRSAQGEPRRPVGGRHLAICSRADLTDCSSAAMRFCTASSLAGVDRGRGFRAARCTLLRNSADGFFRRIRACCAARPLAAISIAALVERGERDAERLHCVVGGGEPRRHLASPAAIWRCRSRSCARSGSAHRPHARPRSAGRFFNSSICFCKRGRSARRHSTPAGSKAQTTAPPMMAPAKPAAIGAGRT